MVAGRWSRTWRPLLIAAVGAAAYSNSFGGVFLFDDEPTLASYLVRDPVLAWPHYLGQTVGRPVVLVTFAANYAAGGLDPWGYHLVNLLIHLANAMLLFALVARTLRLPGTLERLRMSAEDVALVVAAAWVVHPLTTQAVTYVVQRMESLMAFWYLLTLYAVRRAATAEGWARSGWSFAAVLTSWLCVGSKEVGVTVPAVALLYDRCYLAGSWAGAVRRRGPVYMAMAVGWLHLGWLFAVVARGSGIDVPTGPAAVTPLDYALSQPGVLLHYLRLAVWPDGLCFDPRWPVARHPFEYVPQAVAAAASVAATAWALWKRPRVGFLPAAALLVLAPTSTVVPIRDLMFEYRMYLPLAPLTVLAALALEAVLPRPWFLAAVTAVVVALGVRTNQRNELYRDPVAMWEDVTRQRPGNPRAQFWLGKALLDANRPAAAAERFRLVIAFDGTADPHNALDDALLAEAHGGWGTALTNVGDDAAAAEQFRLATALNPLRPAYARHLADAEARVKR
jgi:hypothetical protein